MLENKLQDNVKTKNPGIVSSLINYGVVLYADAKEYIENIRYNHWLGRNPEFRKRK